MDEKRLVDGTTALAEKQARVIKIEPTERPQNVRLRVAAYTRVSSDSEDQLIIPASVRVTEANMEGKSIFAYDNKCKVADAYRNLTKEVLDIAAREKARFRDDGSR